MSTFLVYEPRRAIRDVLVQRLVGLAAPGPSPERRDAGRRSTGSSVEWVDDPEQFVTAYARRPAQVVLVGVVRAESTGAELTRRLLGVFPEAVVIVLGAAADSQAVGAALAVGAHGFLRLEDLCAPSPARPRALLGAVSLVVREPGPTGATPADRLAGSAPDREALDDALTRREHQILVGMSQGLSNGAIGAELYVSEDTVKTHARRLYGKLGVRDRGAAVAAGFRRRLLV